MRHEDGHWVWLRARAALAPGDTARSSRTSIGIVFDITAAEASRTSSTRKPSSASRTRSRTSPKPSCCGTPTTGWCCAIRSTSSSIPCPPPSACRARPMMIVAHSAKEPHRASSMCRRQAATGQEATLRRGAARRRPLAADQRAPHQGWRLRFGRHRHHGAEEAGGAPAAVRARR